MAYILNNQNIATWRFIDNNRPWYQKALSLLPNLSKATVIELGSGGGELASVLKPKTKSLVCTDYSSNYITKLKKKGLTAIQSDFNQKLQFRKEKFDFVISLEVIEHLINAENFLNEIRRIIKPKGQLIISTPNIAWWGYRFYSLLGRPPKKEGYHFRFFTHKTLINCLNQAGFEVINSKSFTTIPFFNRLLILFKIKPLYPTIKIWPNLLAQNLVFLCQKK